MGHIVHFKVMADCESARRAPLAQAHGKVALEQVARRAGFVAPSRICLLEALPRSIIFLKMAPCLTLLTSEPLWIGGKGEDETFEVQLHCGKNWEKMRHHETGL